MSGRPPRVSGGAPRQPGSRAIPARSAIALGVLLTFAACGRQTVQPSVAAACDSPAATFGIDIDNLFFPLPVGQQTVLEGPEAGGRLVVRITVLDELERVGSVTTRVVEEHESRDGRVIEVSRNYFAQAEDGTVCYFGEAVDVYGADGAVTSHAGAWRADEAPNRPGLFMPTSLSVGQTFHQEVAPGIAEDEATVIAIGEPTEVPAGSFSNTLTVEDRSPLDGSRGIKVYARGVGLIVDGPARLTEHTVPR